MKVGIEHHKSFLAQMDLDTVTRLELEVRSAICRLYYFVGEYREEDLCGEELHERAGLKNDREFIARGFYFRGQAHRLMGKLTDAYSYMQRSIDLQKGLPSSEPLTDPHKPHWLGNTYIGLGNVLINAGMSDEALVAYQNASTYFVPESYPAIIVKSNLIFVLNEMGQHEQALQHVESLKQIAKSVGYIQAQVITWMSSASTHGKLGEFDIAIQEYEKALQLIKQHERKENYIDAYSGLTEVYIQKGDLDKAVEYNLKLRDLVNTKDAPKHTILPYLNFAKIERLRGNTEWAIQHIADAYRIFKDSEGALPIGKEVLSVFSQVLADNKDFEKALSLQYELMQFSDELYSKERQSRLDILDRRFALIEQEYEIEKQQAELERLKVNHDKQRWMFIAYLVGGTLIIALIAVAYRRAHEKQQLAEKASLAKSEFLATISHELRTPVNGVIGAISLIDTDSLSFEQKRYLDIVKTSGQNILTIVNDTLDLSKIEAGKLTLEMHEFELVSCIEGVIDLFTYDVMEKDLLLTYILVEPAPKIIRSDSTRLRQVLVNLIGNALKFTSQGAIVVYVYSETIEDNTVSVHFQVKDSGIGMKQETLDRLFNAFEQADPSITRKFGGTGLGLNICKRIVELMGGKITVTSDVNKGTIFDFNIVVDNVRSPVVEYLFPDWHNMRLLIVTHNAYLENILTDYCHPTSALLVCIHDFSSLQQRIESPQSDDLLIIDSELLTMNESNLSLFSQLQAKLDSTPILIIHKADQLADTLEVLLMNERSRCIHLPLKQNAFYHEVGTLFGKDLDPKTLMSSPDYTQLSKKYPFNILVVEDNAIGQLMIRQMLETMGYSINVASNGVEGYDLAMSLRPDLILTDGKMPEMGGVEMAQKICNNHQHYKPAIILITGSFMSEDYIKATESVHDILLKPVNRVQLGQMIEKIGAFIYGASET